MNMKKNALHSLVIGFGICWGVFIAVCIIAVVGNLFFGMGDPPLVSAAERGDLAEVRRLVEGGASIDQVGLFGWTPLDRALHSAVVDHKRNQHGVTEVVEYLLAKGASVEGATLDHAISYGNLDIVKTIVGRGKKPSANSLARYLSYNVGDRGDRTDLQLVDFLLDHGADVNSVYDDDADYNYNALGWAVFDRDLSLTMYLVGRGADVNAPMKDGETPLNLATKEYKLGIGPQTGPGIHYYRVVVPAPAIVDFLRQHGAR